MKTALALIAGTIGMSLTYGCAMSAGEKTGDSGEAICSGSGCAGPKLDAGVKDYQGDYLEAVGTTAIYFISGLNEKHLVPDMQTFEAVSGGASVIVVAASVLDAFPTGASLPHQDLANQAIWSTPSGVYYFSNLNRLYQLPDLTTGSAWGGNVGNIKALPPASDRTHTRDEPQPLPSVLPFSVAQQDEISGDYHYHMTTSLTVDASGSVTGNTSLQSTYGLLGFTGGMQITLFDVNGNALWASPLEQWGVNPNTSIDHSFSFQVPQSTLNSAKSVVITQVRDEKNTVLNWIETALAGPVVAWVECEVQNLVFGFFGGTTTQCTLGSTSASGSSVPACTPSTDSSCQTCTVGSPGCSSTGTCDPNSSPSCGGN